MTIRCANCDKNVLEDLKWNNWLNLYHFISFLESEETITPQTAEQMINCLMSFKLYATEENNMELFKYKDVLSEIFDHAGMLEESIEKTDISQVAGYIRSIIDVYHNSNKNEIKK